jgi:hypothetical protein
MEIPNPGSQEALDMGCSCPVMDNAYGKGSGFTDDEGKPVFWYTEGCPVHKSNVIYWEE